MHTIDPYSITVVNSQRGYRVNGRRLADVARRVLAAEAAAPADVEIAVVDDPAIARINLEYLDHEGPTDVISFDLGEDHHSLTVQLVISADTARRRADELGHSTLAELSLYVAHGLLHQLGYDDQTPADRNEMHARQAQLLAEMGIRLKG